MISKLTLGTVQFGMDYGINNSLGKPSKLEVFKMLDYAYSMGITSIDTAAAYGDSEDLLGSWISQNNRENLYITSKIQSINKVNITRSELEAYVEKDVEDILKRLNIEYLDNIMIHDVKDIEIFGDNLFSALENIKEKKYVKNIGVSLYDLETLDSLKGKNIDTIQIPGNIFNQRLIKSKELNELKEKNVKTFVRSAFIQGLIFMEKEKIPLRLRGLSMYLDELNEISRSLGISKAHLALVYLFKQRNIDSVVVGVDNMDQLKELANFDFDVKIDDAEIERKFSNISANLIDPRMWRD